MNEEQLAASAYCCSEITEGRKKKVDRVLALVGEGAILRFCVTVLAS
jgi:hypothetical protein